MILMNAVELRKRLDKVYGAMQQRAKPRLWKSGKKKGVVRVQGLSSLPFTRQQLWNHVLDQFGDQSAMRCPYCVEIGRPAVMIDLASCVLDHKVPLSHGGTWELSNMLVCCADCNRLKGHLTYPFFIGLMAAIERWEDQRDRANMHMCMRTHGVTQRLKFQAKKKVGAVAEINDPQPTLDMRTKLEEW